MLNRLPLNLQVRQRAPANILRLVGDALAVPQPLAAAVQPVRPAEQLLALLELVVLGRVVRVAGAEEGGAVRGKGFEPPFGGVDVGFEVAEAWVQARACGGGDVLFFDAHHVELFRGKRVQYILGYGGWDFAGERECAERGRTSSLASSRECSANRTADFRGSPDSSVI